jgi:hypothetical protein
LGCDDLQRNNVATYLKLSDSVLHTTEVSCRRLLSLGADLRFDLARRTGGGFGASPGRISVFELRGLRDLSVTALGLMAGTGGGLGGSSGRNDACADFDLVRW